MKNGAYTEYKESGVEWLGNIPKHWETKKIGHTTYVKGRIGWQGLTSEEFVDEGPFCVTGTDFIGGKVDWNTCYHVSDERYNEDPYIKLHDEDLLITKDGTIGKTAIVKELCGRATLNSGIFLTRPMKRHYDTGYMYWVLNSTSFSSFIEMQKTGTTIAHLYQNVFVRFKYPLPSLPEQQNIAAFLDRETGRIDTLIAQKQRLLELLAEQRTALISRAVTKGLHTTVKMKPSGVEWLGEVPEHWEVKRLKFLAQIQTGNTPPKIEEDNYSEEGYPWVKPDNLAEFAPILETKECLSNKGVLLARPVPENSPLVCCIGTVGKFGFSTISVTTNQQINAVLFSKHINKRFGLFVISAAEKEHIRYANTNVVSILNGENQKQIGFPLPPLPEQKTIATFLDRETAKIEILAKKIENVIEHLKEYRTALISAAVTGKIDVREAI